MGGWSDPSAGVHVSQASGGGELHLRVKNGCGETCEGHWEESSSQGA